MGGHGCWVVGKREGFVVVLVVVGRLLGVDGGGLVRRKKFVGGSGKGEGRLSRRLGRERVSYATTIEKIDVMGLW